MQLYFDTKLAENYKNSSQIIRVLSESWVESTIFCANCSAAQIERYANNNPVSDFYCKHCGEDYELKSKKDRLENKLLDGAYQTKINRLTSNKIPNLFLLVYDSEHLSVSDFMVIPKHFFIPEIIEKRKPLSSSARRFGWIGSYIFLDKVPQSGKIFYVKNRNIETKAKVISKWNKTIFLRSEKNLISKGWLVNIMRCIDDINQREFTIDQMYSFEKHLSLLHPNNKHIKEKIRQQLQLLRNMGYLTFIKPGVYGVK